MIFIGKTSLFTDSNELYVRFCISTDHTHVSRFSGYGMSTYEERTQEILGLSE